MKELNYGFLTITPGDVDFMGERKPDKRLDLINTKHIDGLFFNVATPFIAPSVVAFCERVKNRGLDLILNIDFHIKLRLNKELVKQAKEITPRLSLANIEMEWTGGLGPATEYHQFAMDNGIEWICFINLKTLCFDIKRRWKIRDFLVEKKIFCVCACGHILSGYLYDDFTIPSLCSTTLKGHNLYAEYNLTIERLQEYLEPLNIISGVGGTRGLASGSYIYNKRVGFKGILSHIPYDLSGTDKIRVNDPPSQYPPYCGAPKDYRPKMIARFQPPKDAKVNDEYVTFAWDNTVVIPRWDFEKNCWETGFKVNLYIIKAMCYYFRRGYHIGVVTSRSEKKEKILSESNEPVLRPDGSVLIDNISTQYCIENVVFRYELPVKQTFFANGIEKGPLLKEIRSVLHFDHDDKQLQSARKHGIRTRKIVNNVIKYSLDDYEMLSVARC